MNTMHENNIREGRLVPTEIERIGWSKSKNRMTAWLVRAYRIVDANGKDLVQLYDRTKREARKTAKALGIRLLE
jgi:hypothetical protein